MLVESAELRDFRSYSRAHARIAPALTIVHGANGAGKSTLLEGIYYGCTGHSPRTRNERELVRFGARAARVVVQLRDGGDMHELSVGYEAPADGRPATKRMRCDGAPVERMLDLDARPLISVFEPDRLELVKGAPGARRAHLDQLVAALWPSRAQHRRDYSRVLVQRNALLARIRSRSASSATLSSWDRELARTALAVTADRAAAVGQSVIATTDLANVPHALGPNVGRLRVGGGTILGEAAAA